MDATAETTRSRTAARLGAVMAALIGVLPAWGGAAQAGSEARPPRHLRDTGLYASWADRTVRPDNLPFSPQYPLWTDGAGKRRWVHIPRGKWVDASRPDDWVFPPGTRFWKEFSFGRRVETRYLERRRDGSWLYAAYVWTEDGRDAVLAPELGVAVGNPTRPGVKHDVPGVTDCRACHEGKTTPVLGFDALQLSWERDPLAPHAEPAGAEQLDLRALVARGLVRGLPARLLAEPPRIAAPSPRARAALGYLHANCGGCHNDSGPLASLGMTLAHRWPQDAGRPLDAVRTTVGERHRGTIPGTTVAETRRVVPGRPEASALLLRMRTRHPLVQMPPLGTRLVDTQAVTLLERWIAEDLGGPAPTFSSANPTTNEEKTP